MSVTVEWCSESKQPEQFLRDGGVHISGQWNGIHRRGLPRASCYWRKQDVSRRKASSFVIAIITVLMMMSQLALASGSKMLCQLSAPQTAR